LGAGGWAGPNRNLTGFDGTARRLPLRSTRPTCAAGIFRAADRGLRRKMCKTTVLRDSRALRTVCAFIRGGRVLSARANSAQRCHPQSRLSCRKEFGNGPEIEW
jgi:hypothetical protein